MFARLTTGCIAISAALTSLPVSACEQDPFLFQLRGETEADAQERSDKGSEDRSVVEHYQRETDDFEKAIRVYLAKVISRTHGRYEPGNVVLPSTKVRPVTAMKGSLPSEDRILTDEAASGMCSDLGDGEGAFANADDLLIVFEGLPITLERPRGIDSFHARHIRTIPLLDEMRKHGRDLEE